MVDHENLVTISCFRTFLIFIQSYIFNFFQSRIADIIVRANFVLITSKEGGA